MFGRVVAVADTTSDRKGMAEWKTKDHIQHDGSESVE